MPGPCQALSKAGLFSGVAPGQIRHDIEAQCVRGPDMLSLTHCHPRHPAQQCFWYIPAGLSLTVRHPRIGSSAGNGGGTKWAVAEMKGHRTGTSVGFAHAGAGVLASMQALHLRPVYRA